VVDDFVRQVKFWLKVLPDVVVLAMVDLEQNLLSQLVVEVLGACSVLS